MNERLDYILNILAPGHQLQGRAKKKISDWFERAGYGSIEPYLQKLIEKGYVEEEQGDPSIYRLNEKGASLYRKGGFVHHEQVMQERRVALICSVISVLGFAALVLYFMHQR